MASEIIFGVIAFAIAGVIARPFRVPDFVFALAGAFALVASGLLPWSRAREGVAKGADVYLFLIGMMILAEIARREGLFDCTSAHAVRFAKGSAARLFLLVYSVGTIVTIFLSNDATVVVLTPAVYAATKAADAEPLPHLFACAFIANAASFVLPISNPANLVMFGADLPPLGQWLGLFAAPSIAAILMTYLALRLSQRGVLRQQIRTEIVTPELSREAKIAALGLGATAVALTIASWLGRDLGLPTFACGLLALTLVCFFGRKAPLPFLREISWGVLPLVAGLFVLVEGLAHAGAIEFAAARLRDLQNFGAEPAAAGAGLFVALFSNIANNLPMGLVASFAGQAANASALTKGAMLIGVDLGPNLSVTGSLATLLWLAALRREGVHISGWAFLKLGALVTPPALAAALAALIFLV